MDVLLKILEQLKSAKPENRFISDMYVQYCNIGGLSKKQLQGLLEIAKASQVVSQPHLATMEAMIRNKVTRQKSTIVKKAPEYYKGESITPQVEAILQRYPQHKMALFLQSKIKTKQPITDLEISEINRLAKLLIK